MQRSLPLRRESVIDAKMLTRVLTWHRMSQLAIAAIESGEERIVPTDVSDAGSRGWF